MGLKESSSNITFINIKDGNLSVKQNDGNYKSYRSLGGIIKKVGFATNTSPSSGVTYQTAKIIIDSDGESFQLEMYTDSRYFLSLCNFLKSSDPLQPVEISPSQKIIEGKKIQTCFVRQNDIALKAAYTKDRMGDLPPLEPVAGQTYLDNKKQIKFWKEWLISTYGEFKVNAPTLVSGPSHSSPDNINNLTEIVDDLPF